MRKSHHAPDGQAAGNPGRSEARPPLAAGESAIAHRIRALRAEARAVYAEMSAAMLATRKEKK